MALIVASLSTVGAQAVSDVLNGQGTAITFQNFGEGRTLEGATHNFNEVCGSCEIRIRLGDGQFVLVDSDGAGGGSRLLEPGVYELRDYKGLFFYTQNAPHDFSVQLHGAGKLIKLG